MFAHLRKTPGLTTWQGYSRYDAILTPDGRLRVIELNTACPGAFVNAPRIHRVLRTAITELLGPNETLGESAGPPISALTAFILGIDGRSGLQPGLVTILNDENELIYEMPLLRESIATTGRHVALVRAEDLELVGGQLVWRGERISTTFNKFRISTPRSPNHCWREGFESRYAAFLGAVKEGVVASINNPVAMTVAEDKGLLALLHEEEVRCTLTADERALVDEHVAWTARLDDVVAGRVALPHGIPSLREGLDRLVVKPANEGRGFAVRIGPHESDEECIRALAAGLRFSRDSTIDYYHRRARAGSMRHHHDDCDVLVDRSRAFVIVHAALVRTGRLTPRRRMLLRGLFIRFALKCARIHADVEAAFRILDSARDTGVLTAGCSDEARTLVEGAASGTSGEDDPTAVARFPELAEVCHSLGRRRARGKTGS